MNASMGLSPDMFASDVQTSGDNHRSYTVRNHTAPARYYLRTWVGNTGLRRRVTFILAHPSTVTFNPEFTSNICITSKMAMTCPELQ